MMDSDELPIDVSHPAVRDYLALVRYLIYFGPCSVCTALMNSFRLQVLTPLSLLINITTIMVCTLVIHPNLGVLVECDAAIQVR